LAWRALRASFGRRRNGGRLFGLRNSFGLGWRCGPAARSTPACRLFWCLDCFFGGLFGHRNRAFHNRGTPAAAASTAAATCWSLPGFGKRFG
jgi:hypothetical protein